jgi:hypothetical protein
LIACAHSWAERFSLDQKLPAKVTDRATLAQVARLLGCDTEGGAAATTRPRAAEADLDRRADG